jgi:hypothetical protein
MQTTDEEIGIIAVQLRRFAVKSLNNKVVWVGSHMEEKTTHF